MHDVPIRASIAVDYQMPAGLELEAFCRTNIEQSIKKRRSNQA
jgi:hypothetical protein